MNFVVLIPKIEGYIHTEGMRELASAISCGLVRLGHQSSVEDLDERFAFDERRPIVLGVHLLKALPPMELPKSSILYHLEAHGTEMFLQSLPHLRAASHVWDFSEDNIRHLAALGIRATLVEPGYVPELEQIRKSAEKDIDVLFYGSLNDRRIKILLELRARGLNAVHVMGVYGAERDDLIARSKVVLNMHYYENPGLFESIRVSYLLANGVCVVSEGGVGQDGYDKCAVVVPYGSLVETCERYVKYDHLRAIAASARETFMTLFPQEESLRRALVSRPTLCLIITGHDTESFKKMDFFEAARAEADELVLIKAKGGLTGGQGHIFNRIAARTLCDVVGACHADTTFAPGALSIFARAAAAGAVVGLVGRAEGEHANGQGYIWSRDITEETPVSCLDGCSIFLRRNSGLRFDEETFSGWHCNTEDLCLQAHERGIPVVVPPADAYHHSSSTGSYLNPEWQAMYWATREKLVAKWAHRKFNTT